VSRRCPDPGRVDRHPLRCHRRRNDDRVVSDKLQLLPRSLTVPLYLVLLAVAAVIVWAGSFRARVDGSIGLYVELTALIVTLTLALLLFAGACRSGACGGRRVDCRPDGRRPPPRSGGFG
jgi:hypothetical protein